MSRTHLKPLIAAARPVRDAILQVEDMTDQAVIAGLDCLRTMMQQRRDAGLAPATGEAQIRIALQAIHQGIDCRSTFLELHRSLGELRQDLGLEPWFGPSETVPNTPRGENAIGERSAA